MDQEQWVNHGFCHKGKTLAITSGDKLDVLSPPAILGQEFIRVFPVCDPSLLPHLSLAANTQLLGYLSRAPIKGCHSGLQCPRANHIRAPAHALPLLCCSSPAILIPFKYFHRWPISHLRRKHVRREGNNAGGAEHGISTQTEKVT